MVEEKIKSISEYIEKVSKKAKSRDTEGEIIVYRGESRNYKDSSCVPNIFRGEFLKNNENLRKASSMVWLQIRS